MNGKTQDFVERFAAIVAQHPDNIAVLTDGTQAVTYRQLHEKGLKIAAALKAAGAGPETIIGLQIEKSADYLASLLACWYAGAAFMPLDPKLPEERRKFILEDSRPAIILSRHEYMRQVDGEGRQVIALEDINLSPPADFKPVIRARDSLAYVIYTSGSTGKPKGVLVTHSGLVPMLDAQREAFMLGPDSRSLFYLSTNFDASVSDIGTALLSGAGVCIETTPAQEIAANLPRILADRGVTYVDIPPSVLRIMDPEKMPASLKTITIGGETLDPEVARRWAARFRLVNVYGPTEATVCTSLCILDPDNWTETTVGAPLPAVSYRIAGPDLKEVEPGEAGELLIGGVQLARGYLNRPDLNERKFIAIDGERFYRTGDKVRMGARNEPVFLGRIDRQVKIRGQLVELEEVEAAILKNPAIAQAAVLKKALDDKGERQALVAYVTMKDGAEFNAESLKDGLRSSLSPWMIPTYVIRKKEMPYGVTGKINHEALAAEPLESASTAGVGQALKPAEEKLLAIWKRVLKRDDIGIHDAFYDCGGDSLGLVSMMMEAETEGLSVTPNLVHEKPTIAEMAAYLQEQGGNDPLVASAMTADSLRQEVALDDEWRQLIENARALRDAAPDKPRAVFLTGSNGFLASRLLHELLGHSDCTVHALVRAKTPEEGLRRIEKAMETHGLRLTPDMKARIVPVLGDLQADRMGLTQNAWDGLSRTVDTVIHCGAVVNMTASHDELYGPNVKGTQEALKLALAGQKKRFHYASTLSVFVSTDQNTGVTLESDRLEKTGTVYGGYGQTKWAAEYFLQQIPSDVCAMSIYRLGLITGDTLTGRCAEKDFLHMFVKGVIGLGAIPQGDGSHIEVDSTPVDYCAEAMRHIILKSVPPAQDKPAIYHIANTRGFSLDQILNEIRWRGNQIDTLPPAVWKEKMDRMRQGGFSVQEAAAYLAMVRMLPDSDVIKRHATMDLFQATNVKFDQKNTTEALKGSGIILPPPDNTLLSTYLDAITGKKKEILKRGVTNMRTRKGLIIGKFMPPHKGHAYMIDFARKYVDELYVVVDRLKDEPIPQALRVKWLQTMFPGVKIVPLGDFNPQDPSESESPEIFWRTWERSLKSALPEDIDFVFGSEEYCWELAKRMGARHVPVDSSRSNFPMCATDIRKDPLGHWDYLPDPVKPYFLKKVCIVGAESTGKSTLAEKLAAHFNTIAVPEYARTFLQSLAARKEPRPTQYEDIEIFAEGQLASEDSMATLANRILVCDTDVLTSHVWSQSLYGKSPDFFHQLIDKRDYDLYILANTDVGWVPDIHRQWEEESKGHRRRAFEFRLKAELEARNKPYIEITGADYEGRFDQAKEAIVQRIFKGRTFPDFGKD